MFPNVVIFLTVAGLSVVDVFIFDVDALLMVSMVVVEFQARMTSAQIYKGKCYLFPFAAL